MVHTVKDWIGVAHGEPTNVRASDLARRIRQEIVDQ